MKKIIFLFGASLLLMSCSKNDDGDVDNDIDFEPLHGEVQGAPFLAKGGHAFYNNDKTKISLKITNKSVGCESDPSNYDLYVSLDISIKEGIQNNVNVVFSKNGTTPYNAPRSTVIVDEVTGTNVSVRIESDPEDVNGVENDIEGSITMSICN